MAPTRSTGPLLKARTRLSEVRVAPALCRSRLTVGPHKRVRSAQLNHGQHVAGGVLEPRDRWAASAEDALLVLLGSFVALEADAPPGQLVDRLLYVLHREVQDGKRRRGVIRLGVDQHVLAARDAQLQHAHGLALLGDLHPERLAVEPPGLSHVVYRESAERLRVLEHDRLLSFRLGPPTKATRKPLPYRPHSPDRG